MPIPAHPPILASALLALAACDSGGLYVAYGTHNPVPSATQVITTLDFFGAGQSEAEAFVARLPGEAGAAIRAALERAGGACVRISALTESDGTRQVLEGGSGVLLRVAGSGPTFVGTAAHVLAGGKLGARLTGSSGDLIHPASNQPLSVQLGAEDQDWALVALAEPTASLPALATCPPRVGELAFLLGYPQQAGRDPGGRIVYDPVPSAGRLAPLLAVAEVTEATPLRLRPVAGLLPVDGMSGGAIVNHRGEVIGFVNGQRELAEHDGVTFWITAASVAALPGGSAGESDRAPVAASGGRVITSLDLLAAGENHCAALIAGMPPDERAAVERAARACLRIRASLPREGSSQVSFDGSGVILRLSAGGPAFVGTAGHVLVHGSTTVTYTTTSGEMLQVTASRQEFVRFGSPQQDWGLVPITSPTGDLPVLTTRAPVVGELAFVLSYPERIGCDQAGRIVCGQAFAEKPLAPLRSVGAVTQAAPLQLRPVAGSLALEGSSGGAIVNRRGEVIGLFNTVVVNREAEGPTWWLEGASVEALRPAESR